MTKLPANQTTKGYANEVERIRNQAPKRQSQAALKREAETGDRGKRTPEEQRAEIERVAREHGADLSEEGFNEALRKVTKAR